MAGERYTQELKIAAVQQITQEGHSIPDVARRLRINTKGFTTGELGTRIARQNMNLTKLKKWI